MVQKYVFIILYILFFEAVSAPVKDRDMLYDELLLWQEQVDRKNLKAKIDTADFTKELFLQALYLYVENPEIVYNQAKIETGWFKSPIFRELNNAFGMHYPYSRETTAIGWRWGDYYNGSHQKMSEYTHWSESVKDISLWQQYWRSQGHDLGDYYGFLRDLPYATAPNYIRVLRSMEV